MYKTGCIYQILGAFKNIYIKKMVHNVAEV